MIPIKTQEEYWKPYLDKWKSQGRTKEQIWAVENFMTAQGDIMFKELTEQMIPEEKVVEVVNKQFIPHPDVCGGYNQAISITRSRRDKLLGK